MSAEIKNEQLLAEVEDVLRTMPTLIDVRNGLESKWLPWAGRAAAVIQRWSIPYIIPFDEAIRKLGGQVSGDEAYRTVSKLLYQARADLQMRVGQLSVIVQQGQVFDYFDELRKVIEPARIEVFFVDPYLDAEFVSRYLPHVADGIDVRLLGGPTRMSALLPAVELYAKQSSRPIQVRSSDKLHDRYLFVDRTACYVSGASFKDGAKKAPAVLTQITDAFQATWSTYELQWNGGKVER